MQNEMRRHMLRRRDADPRTTPFQATRVPENLLGAEQSLRETLAYRMMQINRSATGAIRRVWPLQLRVMVPEACHAIARIGLIALTFQGFRGRFQVRNGNQKIEVAEIAAAEVWINVINKISGALE